MITLIESAAAKVVQWLEANAREGGALSVRVKAAGGVRALACSAPRLWSPAGDELSLVLARKGGS